MRKITFLMVMLLFAGVVFAQTYPLVTVQDINRFPDTLHTLAPSPMVGDTVRVQGIVLVRPTISATGDRRPIIYVGARYGTYIQSADFQPWGGLNVITNDTSAANQATLITEVCDTATVCEFTGVVTTYPAPPVATSITELILVPNIPITPILSLSKRADPIPITLEDLWTAPGTVPNYKWQKYNGMYVQLTSDVSHVLITSNRLTGTTSPSGKFQINDQNGNFATMYPASGYFKNAPTLSLVPGGYIPPADGSYLKYIRGLLIWYGTSYEIEPIYPGDIGPVMISPPTISGVKRDAALVKKNQAVSVSATVKPTSASVSGVKLFYTVNGVVDSIAMSKGTDTTLYSATIPACTADSSFVSFYVKATDLNNLSVTSPANITNSRYSYFAFDKALTIQHVKYSPFGTGYSGYNGNGIAPAQYVTVNGTVVGDTSDLPGNHGSNPARVYIQNGTGPWSGLLLGTKGDFGTTISALRRGDNITVTGRIAMTTNGTCMDSLTAAYVLNSSGNPMPAPNVLSPTATGTATLGILTGEPYNGTLVTYNNIVVDNANADGPLYNYGECYVNDGAVATHSRIIWADGNTTYYNDASRVTNVKVGDKFTAITGVLGYTHGYYKLCPRKNDDVVGYVSDVKKENDLRANNYSLNQNYPNPFNPSTTISYSIPVTGMVTLKVFNTLGQEVKTLVSQVQNNGNYRVTFDASSVPSGIYFYSLTANNFAQVKKMILIQ